MTTTAFATTLARDPVVLAPMEDVTDAAFRRVARSVGATLCVTEFVAAEQILSGSTIAQRRGHLEPDDRPTGLQIYGADPDLLLAAAIRAAASAPTFIDINCGCWVPKIARRGAGAGWLREPAAMVEMARRIVAAVDLPVTVKTRIGWGTEPAMPIVDIARRLEDVGVSAIAIHCRTAQMGHAGDADWSWARQARAAVSIPVIVNGDIRSAADVVHAFAATDCAGVMIGRGAIEHPWVFREAHAARLGRVVHAPTTAERVALYRQLLVDNCERRGMRNGLGVTRRYIRWLGDAAALRASLLTAPSLAASLELLDRAVADPVDHGRAARAG